MARRGRTRAAWLPAHDAWLRAHIADGATDAVARALEGAFGVRRTAKAVRVRAFRLGVHVLAEEQGVGHLARQFGVPPRRVRTWLTLGWLRGRRLRHRPRAHWLVPPGAVEAFLRDHPSAYDYRQMRPGPWRTQAEDVWRRAGAYSVREAAQIVHLPARHLRAAITRGELLAARAISYEQGARNRWLIPRRALLSWHSGLSRSTNRPAAGMDTGTVRAVLAACLSCPLSRTGPSS